MITTFSSVLIGQEYADLDPGGTVNELAVSGNGFFVVRDPADNNCHVTQAGDFTLDAEGHLVTDSGARLQGRTGGARSATGDIQINTAALPASADPDATLACYSIDSRGRITVHLSDGTSFLRGQIMLQNFQDPEALVSEGNNLFSNLSAARPLKTLAAPGSKGLGSIHWGVLELAHAGSNSWRN